jgi:hypothetical protein
MKQVMGGASPQICKRWASLDTHPYISVHNAPAPTLIISVLVFAQGKSFS